MARCTSRAPATPHRPTWQLPAYGFTATLDHYARDFTRLDLMKVDVEGHELRVLEGARKAIERLRPVLLVECADRHLRRAGASSDVLIESVRALGYEVVGRTASPTNENILCLPA